MAKDTGLGINVDEAIRIARCGIGVQTHVPRAAAAAISEVEGRTGGAVDCAVILTVNKNIQQNRAGVPIAALHRVGHALAPYSSPS